MLARSARARWLVSWLVALTIVGGFVVVLAGAPAARADSPGVALNELNCFGTGTDWVEVVNRSNTQVSLAGWLLTDDPLDLVPLRDAHRWRFASGTVLAPGAHLVVNQNATGANGFAFELSCSTSSPASTVSLADTTDTLVESYTLPTLGSGAAAGRLTLGRNPDGTGDWTITVPTPGTVNAAYTGDQTDDPAWLYDPLRVAEIDLEISEAALAQLTAVPTEYVDARITMRNGGSTYGPYLVGLKLKGHATFRPLTGKAAFKVKFAFSISKQKFHGLKGLTLNNMVQDPSMISEATSSLLAQALGVPTARVGYAYVRLNGADYGLYADVETVDSVMATRLFGGYQHLYEADAYATDAIPGREGVFAVQEGSTTDVSDLVALTAANAVGSETWWERMQTVADMAEMTRTWATEHYIGQWDGYSVANLPTTPNNYYLHSDLTGTFSIIITGTDQTWLDHTDFGVYGKGVMVRGCVADAACRAMYADELRKIATNPATLTIATQARAIRDAIALWRARDPRLEQSAAAGEAQADTKLATMVVRPSELAAWLSSPSFTAAPYAAWWGAPTAAGGGAVETSDLSVAGTVTPASAPVGGSHVWRLQVSNNGTGTASGVVLDVRLSPNATYGFSQVTRGSGCVSSGTTMHCVLDYLGPAGGSSSTAEVVIGTSPVGAGEVSLTATASFAGTDPTPTDNATVLKATSAPLLPPQALIHPVLGSPVVSPAKHLAGKLITFSLPVTRSDNRKPLLTGKMVCDPSIAGKVIRHAESFKAGKARISFLLPKSARGKLLIVKIRITIPSSGQTVGHAYRYQVR